MASRPINEAGNVLLGRTGQARVMLGRTQVWPRTTTTTTISVPANTTAGTNFIVTADTTAAEGSIQFHRDGAPVGSPVPVDAAGVATYTDNRPTGSYTYYAEYLGTAFIQPSASDPATTATKTATTTTISVPATATAGVAFTLTGDTTATTGAIQFRRSLTAVGTPVPVDASGVATTTDTRSAGTSTYTATYQGDASFQSSVSASASVVVKNATTTTVSVPASSTDGTNFTVTGDTTATSGTIQFYRNGAAVGSPVTVNSSGVATITEARTPGSYTYYAEYLGNTTNHPSTSATASISIAAKVTLSNFTLVHPVRTVQPGTNLEVRVHAHGHSIKTDTIAFYRDGVFQGNMTPSGTAGEEDQQYFRFTGAAAGVSNTFSATITSSSVNYARSTSNSITLRGATSPQTWGYQTSLSYPKTIGFGQPFTITATYLYPDNAAAVTSGLVTFQFDKKHTLIEVSGPNAGANVWSCTHVPTTAGANQCYVYSAGDGYWKGSGFYGDFTVA